MGYRRLAVTSKWPTAEKKGESFGNASTLQFVRNFFADVCLLLSRRHGIAWIAVDNVSTAGKPFSRSPFHWAEILG
jgi:hypothetical protein